MTLPLFWCAPLANRLDDTLASASGAPPNRNPKLEEPPGACDTRVEERSMEIKQGGRRRSRRRWGQERRLWQVAAGNNGKIPRTVSFKKQVYDWLPELGDQSGICTLCRLSPASLEWLSRCTQAARGSRIACTRYMKS